MIIFENRRLCLITPPHTGSRALNRIAPELGGQVIVGPAPDSIDVVDHHWARPPAECDGWSIAVVVRRPESRLVALWNHLNWWRVEVKQRDPMSIQTFVQAIATDDARRLSWLYRWSIVRLVGNLQIAQVIRYENLGVSLANCLGLPAGDVQALLGDKHYAEPLWPAIFSDFDEETRFAARVWCHPDAERWGYQRQFRGEPFKRPACVQS